MGATKLVVDLGDGHFADVTPGESIRLYGRETNRVTPVDYDRTFKVGDAAIHDSYNFAYIGTITHIGAKTVTIEDRGFRTRRLKLSQFDWRNRMLDLAAEAKRQADWSD